MILTFKVTETLNFDPVTSKPTGIMAKLHTKFDEYGLKLSEGIFGNDFHIQCHTDRDIFDRVTPKSIWVIIFSSSINSLPRGSSAL